MLPALRAEPRLPVPRPPGVAVYSYACPRCDLILADGAAYEVCPACNSLVDWVNLSKPVWCCPTCDAMINEDAEHPSCERCRRPMSEIHAWEKPPPPKHLAEGMSRPLWIRAVFESPAGLAVFAVISISPALSFALDPRWRWLGLGQLLPVVLIPLFLGSFILGSAAASFREVRDLLRDRRTRIIHGIEHATVVMLARRGFPVLGGQTDHGYFKLWLKEDRRKGKRREKDGGTEAVRRACLKAVERLRRQRWALAIHPRCGTTWMALFLLASLAAVASVAVGLFTTLQLPTVLTVAGSFLGALILGARPLGWLMQRTMTIAVDFRRAAVQRIVRKVEESGVTCYYVHLDVDPGGPPPRAG